MRPGRSSAWTATEGPAPLRVTFDAIGSPSPETEDIERYDWVLGDGFVAGADSIVHDYNEPGIYEASVEVRYTNGCARRVIQTIVVTCPQEDVNPWTSADVGEPPLPGSARLSGDAIAVCAGGSGFARLVPGR